MQVLKPCICGKGGIKSQFEEGKNENIRKWFYQCHTPNRHCPSPFGPKNGGPVKVFSTQNHNANSKVSNGFELLRIEIWDGWTRALGDILVRHTKKATAAVMATVLRPVKCGGEISLWVRYNTPQKQLALVWMRGTQDGSAMVLENRCQTNRNVNESRLQWGVWCLVVIFLGGALWGKWKIQASCQGLIVWWNLAEENSQTSINMPLSPLFAPPPKPGAWEKSQGDYFQKKIPNSLQSIENLLNSKWNHLISLEQTTEELIFKKKKPINWFFPAKKKEPVKNQVISRERSTWGGLAVWRNFQL